MNEFQLPPDLGPPDLTIAGLRLWVHRPQHPKPSGDYHFEDTWLEITLCCSNSTACAWTWSVCLQNSDIDRFSRHCAAMLREGWKEAILRSDLELVLTVKVTRADVPGGIRVTVDVAPEPIWPGQHRFVFDDVEPNLLTNIVRDCAKILADFPMTQGTPKGPA